MKAESLKKGKTMKTEIIIDYLQQYRKIAHFDSISEIEKLNSIIKELEKESQKAAARNAGKQDLFKAIERILKESRKRSCRPALHYAFKNANEKTYITDSYRAIEISNTDGLELENNPDSFNPPEMSKLMIDNSNTYETINIADLESAVKLAKQKSFRKNKYIAVYVFNNNMVMQCQYIIDGMLSTGSNECNYTDEKPYGLMHMYSKDKNVHYIALPMRLMDREKITVSEKILLLSA